MFWQKDRLHSAEATTISVDSFRRDLWMFLYEAYFVWLPIMYFHCAGCAHLCPGLRSLGCGWLWDECSPRLLGSRKPFTCRSSRVFPAICGCVWWVRVRSLSLCPTGESRLWFGGRRRRKATVLRCIVIRTHLAMKFRRVHVDVLLQFSRGTLYCGCVPCTTVCTGRDPPKFCTTVKKIMKDIDWWQYICPAQLEAIGRNK